MVGRFSRRRKSIKLSDGITPEQEREIIDQWLMERKAQQCPPGPKPQEERKLVPIGQSESAKVKGRWY